MAGYFELVGKIVTEKGAWYKIGFFVFLAFLLNVFQPKLLLAQMAIDLSDFNLAGWLILVLASLMSAGFSIQVYANRIKTDKTVFPEFDVLGMIVHAFKIIPLNIVWGTYWALYMLLVALLLFAPMRTPSSLSIVLAVIFVLPAVIINSLAYPILLAAHTKSFQYNGFLNPFVLFHILANTGLQMFLNALCYMASILVLVLLIYAMIAVFGMSLSAGSFDFATMGIPVLLAIIIFSCVFCYLLQVFQFAFIARTCDIAKECLAYSDLLDSDFYDEVERKPQISDEELFGGYMRNSSEDDGDGAIKMQNPFDNGNLGQSDKRFDNDDFRFQ